MLSLVVVVAVVIYLFVVALRVCCLFAVFELVMLRRVLPVCVKHP